MSKFTRFISIALVTLASTIGVRASSCSISANFNGTPIAAGNKIWFNAVIKVTGTATYPLTIYFTNQTITSPAFSLSVPDAIVILDPTVTTATTVFNGTSWVTTAQPGDPGFYYLSGYAHTLTSALPGGLDPVTWSGTMTCSRPGVSILWQMGAAVYTTFNTNLNALGVKPSGCTTCSSYPNSHQGGTPENYLAYVIGGARGGGGDNYTGGYSGGDHKTLDNSGYGQTICVGSSVAVHPPTAGSWTSSNTAVATVSDGNITGLSAGTAHISYKISGSSSWQIFDITVIATPTLTVTSSPATLCAGGTLSLSATGTGGTSGSCSSGSSGAGSGFGSGGSGSSSSGSHYSWAGPASFASSAQNPIRTGVTSAMAGVYSVTYTSSNGCSATGTTSVSISTTPSAGTLSGGPTVCIGAPTTFSSTVSGGTWSSSAPGIASVSTTGSVTGVATGSATISYRVTNSCGSAIATRAVTVSSGASAGTLSGGFLVCPGESFTLVSSVTGGSWSSGNTAIATINPSGVVTGVAAGTATISYTVSGSCGAAVATRVVTINGATATPSISGAATLCSGGLTAFTASVAGGSWSSSAPSIASVTPSGVVSGVASGTATISYTVTGACGSATATRSITVGSAPVAGTLSGSTSLCPGTSATYSSTISGGVWSSSAPSVASVTSAGDVTGVASGSAIISYLVTGSCGTATATRTVTIGSAPSAGTITGSSSVCAGATTALSSSVAGGAWSSSSSAASVSASGVVSGVSVGSATISYTVTGACGSSTATMGVVVNGLPAAATISGGGALCVGTYAVLSGSVGGGTWSSTVPAVATVSSAGVLNALASGTTNVSYTVTNGCGSTSTSTSITVNPAAATATISGTTVLCAGTTAAQSSSVTGGTWSSSNTAVATVSTSGLVTAIAAGAATISYTSTGTCGSSMATTGIVVNAAPSAGTISGTSSLCPGSFSALSSTVSGGVWSSSDPSTASVSSMGLVSAIASGSAVMSYHVTNGCGTATATYGITVNPAPDAGSITGSSSMCAGAAIMLSDAAAGGAWTSGATGVATVNSAGVVSGVSAGSATISYTVTNSCGTATATRSVVINGLPDAGTITGNGSICMGQNTTLGNCTAGGAWSSGNISVASVDATGVVTSVSAGTATISYTVTNSCGSATATKVITVNAVPSATLSGPSTTSVGGTIDLIFDGGTWSSSNTGVATVDASGQVTGVSAGTAIITYSVSNACYSFTTTKVVTIDAITLPGITGTLAMCAGSSTTLADASAGGAWSSSNTAVATVSASGVVSGVSAGTATISYSLMGSVATAVVTINAMPAAITGATTLCLGSTDALSNAVTGGTWTSSTPSVAVIDAASGIVSAVSTGTTTIVYTMPGGCSTSVTLNVTTVAPVTGAQVLCAGSTTALSDATTGGTWSSGSVLVATVDASGVVTGVSTGTATISYISASGCVATTTVTVNGLPAAIGGPSAICVGNSAAYTDATTGGAWSASGNVTIDASGNATGVAVGAGSITYTSASGCTVTIAVTVNAVPATIVGPSSLCVAGTVSYTDATTGGTWSSSNTAIATVTSAGAVTGVSAGSVDLTYTAPTGCIATKSITILAGLPAITGNSVICAGGTLALANSAPGGTWSSSNTAVATIGSASGVVTGIAGGTSNITYTVAGGCVASVTVTVNAILPITGTLTACLGNSTTLADGTAGGSWSSSNDAVATVGSSTGIVTGTGGGTAVITYTIANGCTRTAIVTINALPAITGTLQVCTGSTTTIADGTPGGVFSSSNPATASVIGSTGVVTGVAAGTATMTYTAGGCKTTAVVTVNATPPVITGTNNVCLGSSVALSNAATGGVWSSTANISLDATTGSPVNATGVATGVGAVTYTVGTCARTFSLVVNALPAPISGTLTVCPMGTTNLSDATTGGTWSSSNTSIATVALSAGVVTGQATGTAIITYKLSTSCAATAVMTVISSPAPITGPTSVCTGSQITLSDASSPGTWMSTSGVATIGSTTGIVTGVAAGVTNISFTYAVTGCKSTVVVNVIALPNAGTLSGPSVVTVGSTITLTPSGAGGGDWSSSSVANATVGSTGIVTGVASGSATITYAVSNACGYSGAYKPISIAAFRAAPTSGGTTIISKTGTTSAASTVDGATTIESSSTGTTTDKPAMEVTESLPMTVNVLPNPNKGSFTVVGTTGVLVDEVANVEVTNVIGQVIYRSKINVQRGNISEQIQLNGTLPNGTYMLNLKTKNASKVFHFVIRQ